MRLNDKTKKLLILAMDRAASEGEINNASIMLMREFRKQFVDGYALVKEIEEKIRGQEQSIQQRCGRTIITFGKYKGSRLEQIPIDYLMWVYRNCKGALIVNVIAKYLDLDLVEDEEDF